MEINEVWSELKVEKLIGRGSYGTVYKCFTETNGEREYSAVKVISVPQNDVEVQSISSEGMTNEQTREYFRGIIDELLNEVKILESLKGNKNIINILDSKVIEKKDGIGWQIFIKMELLTDFATYISDKKLTEDDVIKMGLDLCEALSVCKDKKIIHRDIKPENIFIDEKGNFKLGDFGVAKQLEKTEASMSRKGTYNYMAPEVLSAKYYDSRADIYSLGLVMYKILNNNRLPFLDVNKQMITHSERQAAFEKRIKGAEIPALDNVSEELSAVILKACRFNADERFRSVEEFASELEAIQNGTNSMKGKVEFSKQKKLLAAVAVVIALSILFGAANHYMKSSIVINGSELKSSTGLKTTSKPTTDKSSTEESTTKKTKKKKAVKEETESKVTNGASATEQSTKTANNSVEETADVYRLNEFTGSTLTDSEAVELFSNALKIQSNYMSEICTRDKNYIDCDDYYYDDDKMEQYWRVIKADTIEDVELYCSKYLTYSGGPFRQDKFLEKDGKLYYNMPIGDEFGVETVMPILDTITAEVKTIASDKVKIDLTFDVYDYPSALKYSYLPEEEPNDFEYIQQNVYTAYAVFEDGSWKIDQSIDYQGYLYTENDLNTGFLY